MNNTIIMKEITFEKDIIKDIINVIKLPDEYIRWQIMPIDANYVRTLAIKAVFETGSEDAFHLANDFIFIYMRHSFEISNAIKL